MRTAVADLVKEFEKAVGDTYLVAQKGGNEWSLLRQKWSATGPPSYTKKRAAHPKDVQELFCAIQRSFEHRLAEKARSQGIEQSEFDQLLGQLHRQLTTIVERESGKYKNVNQDSLSLGGLFAQVSAQKQSDYGDGPAATSVKTCASCGAPRSDDALYGDCQYCGKPLFGKR